MRGGEGSRGTGGRGTGDGEAPGRETPGREAPGREAPGRAMPYAPLEYVGMIEHFTAYACLYVRDEDDRPVQLRSVYGARTWQLTGVRAGSHEC